MPQNDPSAYRGMSQDAHIAFRALPRDQQYALLSQHTGTSNMGTLAYVANIVRNDPYAASRVMEQMVGGPEALQMVDDRIPGIGASSPQQPQQPQPQQMMQPQPMQGGVNVPGQIPTSPDQSQQQQPPTGTNPGGVMQDATGNGQATPMQLQGNAAPAQQSQQPQQPGGVEDSFMYPYADIAAIAGVAGAAEYGANRIANRDQSGVTSQVEDDIGRNIDTSDAIAGNNNSGGRDLPAATPPRVASPDVPEAPVQVGNYVITNDSRIVDVKTGQVVPEDAAQQIMTRIRAYLASGGQDAQVLEALAPGVRGTNIVAPEDIGRLEQILMRGGATGSGRVPTPASNARGRIGAAAGRGIL